jgi:Zn-dependent M28 family amino/carboxypeptidase
VLLAAARAFAAHLPDRAIGLLFTAAEERGFLGARAFCAWAQTGDIAIADVINFDMLGRGRIAVRPSALPGFYFNIPGIGTLVYDGRRVLRGAAYPQPDPALIRRLQTALRDNLVIYRRFTAHSDSNIFQEAGLPTVSLSSDDMYYLDLIWDRDSDRVELLDERNLALALRLVIGK